MTFYFAGNEQGVLSCIFVIKELLEVMLGISASLFPQTGAPDGQYHTQAFEWLAV